MANAGLTTASRTSANRGEAPGGDQTIPVFEPPSEQPAAEAGFPAPRIVDVWSRTASKYRRRAVVFLLVSSLLFAGLTCFAFWVRTGEFFAPALPDYPRLLWKCFDWRSETPITLTDMLFYPIHVQRVPMMLVIVGLTMGTLIGAPILIAILYRFPASLIFAAMVAFLSLMPWLAVNVVIACWLATFRRIRMRYASALLGLLPLVLYFLFSTSGSAATQLAPAEQIKAYFPWILAMLWAAVLMGVVLALAGVVNYRPGVIAPLLAISLTVPVLLFENRVGRDELYYRLLERECGPRSPRHFADLGRDEVIRQVAARRLAESLEPGRSESEVRERLDRWWYLPPGYLHSEMAERMSALIRSQLEVVQRCDTFLRDFPRSRYVPCALYLKARALDMRIDSMLFSKDAVLRHYDDVPAPASRDPWIRLLNQFPQSALSAVARVRLATFQARQARIDEALSLLEEVEQLSGSSANADGRTTGLFGPEAPEASLAVSPDRIIDEARKLRALLERNRDPQYGDAPLAALMRMDPRNRAYDENLRLLQRRFLDSSLARNFELARLLLVRSRSQRIASLTAFVRDAAGDDAVEQGLFELGNLYEEDSQPEKAREIWGRLVAEHADSPWAAEAARRAERADRRMRQQG